MCIIAISLLFFSYEIVRNSYTYAFLPYMYLPQVIQLVAASCSIVVFLNKRFIYSINLFLVLVLLETVVKNMRARTLSPPN